MTSPFANLCVELVEIVQLQTLTTWLLKLTISYIAELGTQSIKESLPIRLDLIMYNRPYVHNGKRLPQRFGSVSGPTGTLPMGLLDVRHLAYALVSLGSVPVGSDTLREPRAIMTLYTWPIVHNQIESN